jgi:hypothetical protein
MKTTIHIPALPTRHAVLVACVKRYGATSKIMKDRRTPRGGTRNKQREYREERY